MMNLTLKSAIVATVGVLKTPDFIEEKKTHKKEITFQFDLTTHTHTHLKCHLSERYFYCIHHSLSAAKTKE